MSAVLIFQDLRQADIKPICDLQEQPESRARPVRFHVRDSASITLDLGSQRVCRDALFLADFFQS